MDKKTIDEIRNLVDEGKPISKVKEENYPQYEYWDIYMAAYSGGQRSAQGVKRMITARLDKMVKSTRKEDRKAIQDELDELVWKLYDSLKKSQQKLEKIRDIIK